MSGRPARRPRDRRRRAAGHAGDGRDPRAPDGPGDPTREDFPSGTAAAAANGVTTVIEHTHGQPGPHRRRAGSQARAPRRALVGRLRAGGARLGGEAGGCRGAVARRRDLLQALHVHHARRAGARRGRRCWSGSAASPGSAPTPGALRGRGADRRGRGAPAGGRARGPADRPRVAQPHRRGGRGGRRRRAEPPCRRRGRRRALQLPGGRGADRAGAGGRRARRRRGVPAVLPAARAGHRRARRAAQVHAAGARPHRRRRGRDVAAPASRQPELPVLRPRAQHARAEARQLDLAVPLRPAGARHDDAAAARRGGPRQARLRGRGPRLQRRARAPLRPVAAQGRARGGRGRRPRARRPVGGWTLGREHVLSKAGWTPYEGREVRGRVVRTLLRGETVDAQAGELRGRFLPGAGA